MWIEWFLEMKQELVRMYFKGAENRRDISIMMQVKGNFIERDINLSEISVNLIDIQSENADNLLCFMDKCNTLDTVSALYFKEDLKNEFKLIKNAILLENHYEAIFHSQLLVETPLFSCFPDDMKQITMDILKNKDLILKRAKEHNQKIKELKKKGDRNF